MKVSARALVQEFDDLLARRIVLRTELRAVQKRLNSVRVQVHKRKDEIASLPPQVTPAHSLPQTVQPQASQPVQPVMHSASIAPQNAPTVASPFGPVTVMGSPAAVPVLSGATADDFDPDEDGDLEDTYWEEVEGKNGDGER